MNIEHQDDIENIEFHNELTQNIAEYGRFVTLGRAIPQLVDGLKPVTRRALYTMHQLNLYDKYVKSSKAVGDLGGEYHPYGDASNYQTLVNMAAVYNYRMRYIDGYGNFGGSHYDTEDRPAAQRYTSVKLSAYSKFILSDLKHKAYDTKLNYDSTKNEPITLPLLLPNILINGSDGIGVGFATNIPSHCPHEIIDAMIGLLNNQNDNIYNYIKGPDFITGGRILNAEIFEAVSKNETEEALHLVGTYLINEEKQTVTITGLPHGVAKDTFILDVVEKSSSGKITNLKNIQDYSDSQGMNIEMSYTGSGEVVVNQLIKKTSFRVNIRYNSLLIHNGTPTKFHLEEILRQCIRYREMSITSRLKKSIDTAYTILRKHLLEMIAQENTNSFIKILRSSDNIKDEIIKYLQSASINKLIQKHANVEYTKIFANCDEKDILQLLNIRMGQLSKKEMEKTNDAILKNLSLIDTHVENLDVKKGGIKNLIIAELEDAKNTLQDGARKTELVYHEDYKTYKMYQQFEYIYGLTDKGYLYNKLYDSVHVRNRSTMGSIFDQELNKYENMKQLLRGFSHDDLYIITNAGRVYKIKSPSGGTIYLHSEANIPKTEKIIYIFKLGDNMEGIVMLTDTNKLVKIAKSHLEKTKSSGKFLLADNTNIVSVHSYEKEDKYVVLLSNTNYIVKYQINTIKKLRPRSTGLKAGKDTYSNIIVCQEESKIAMCTEDGNIKIIDLKTINDVNRPAKGVKVSSARKGAKISSFVCINSTGYDYVLLYTNLGKILKLDVTKIKTQSRRSVGLIAFDKKVMLNDKIIGITI